KGNNGSKYGNQKSKPPNGQQGKGVNSTSQATNAPKQENGPNGQSGGKGNNPATQAANPNFDKPRTFTCYNCGTPVHKAQNCPHPRREKPSNINLVKNLQSPGELLKKYLHNWKVNGQETSILKDTGSSDDLVSRKLISKHHYTGEI